MARRFLFWGSAVELKKHIASGPACQHEIDKNFFIAPSGRNRSKEYELSPTRPSIQSRIIDFILTPIPAAPRGFWQKIDPLMPYSPSHLY
jgi:hypothetical protein